MLKINIKDTRGVLKDFSIPDNFKRELSKQLQQTILQEMKNNIIDEASRTLKSSRQEYIDSVVVTSNSIELNGWLANSIEEGISAYDLKNGFSKSPKKKPSKKGGWYLTIPLPVGTPRQTQGTRMTWGVYRAVLRGKKYDSGTSSQRPAFSVLNTGTVYPAYQHRNPILQGINRRATPTGRSTYNTFRRVSNNSDPASWIHRGILPHRIFDKSWKKLDLQQIIQQVISSNL